MKICWDNLEKLKLNSKGFFVNEKGTNPMVEVDFCKECGDSFLAFIQQIKKGKGEYCSKECSAPIYGRLHITHTEEAKRKIGISSKMKKGTKSSRWKGGVTEKNISLYDTYAHQISYAEKIRRSPNDSDVLEVKCTYCNKWYKPKINDVHRRIRTLEGKEKKGENRFYCSSSCKQECPIFNQRKYPKGYKKASSREVQPELRQLVFKRDNWTCQKCKSKKLLHCHHVEGIRWDPLESADIDKCITYCRKCHIEVHKIEECRTMDMVCNKKEVKAY